MPRLQLACAACGWTPGSPETDPHLFRCPRAGTDDGDHILAVTRDFSPGAGRLAGETRVNSPIVEQGFSPASNPFLRYRTSLYSWHVAQARGGSDADRDYCSLVDRVDAAVERVAGTGFRVTPLLRVEALDKALGFDPTGGIWIKDETRNVSGSHKARHMMGVALYLEVLRRFGIEGDTGRPLAVASCGNAALAAAVVARAIDRRLLVFVPDHAAPAVVLQLEHAGGSVTRPVERQAVKGFR